MLRVINGAFIDKKAWISFVFVFLLLASIFFPSCSLFRSMKNDPYFETFYEKTSIIMTDEEKAEYKNLSDPESKKIFIEEFWRIRDPDLGTEENENQYLFEERIEYANRWFGWRRPQPSNLPDSSWDKYYGWNTERGRVYLVMGELSLSQMGRAPKLGSITATS